MRDVSLLGLFLIGLHLVVPFAHAQVPGDLSDAMDQATRAVENLIEAIRQQDWQQAAVAQTGLAAAWETLNGPATDLAPESGVVINEWLPELGASLEKANRAQALGLAVAIQSEMARLDSRLAAWAVDQPRLRTPDVEVGRETKVTVPILAENLKEVAGFTFALRFDPTVLAATGARVKGGQGEARLAHATEGVVQFAAVSASELFNLDVGPSGPQAGVMAEVDFTGVGEIGAESRLDVTDLQLVNKAGEPVPAISADGIGRVVDAQAMRSDSTNLPAWLAPVIMLVVGGAGFWFLRRHLAGT